eukprot:snap_masked-scaffold_12-processed-gene-10.45-mRNA-1 protein AED:1.00 eAED:1.00 QI:0/-1/0/0/-1/1/1/0/90
MDLVQKEADVTEQVRAIMAKELEKVFGCYITLNHGNSKYATAETVHHQDIDFNLEFSVENGTLYLKYSCSSWLSLNLSCQRYALVFHKQR